MWVIQRDIEEENMNYKVVRRIAVPVLSSALLVANVGCQNTIATQNQNNANANVTPAASTASTTPSSSSSIPVAVQGTTAVSTALTQAATAAAGNSTAVGFIAAANALLSLPTSFMSAFATQSLHALSTTLTRSATYAGTTYSVTYTSDDNYDPLANWSLSVTGGAFSSATTLITGQISQTGQQGNWSWAGSQLGGQVFSVNWNTDGSGTITVGYTVGTQQACTLTIQTSGHGTYNCPPAASGTF